MVEFPVTEGDDDMGKLKALAFVNGENADAVGGNTLDSLATDGFFPLKYKSVNIRAVFKRKLVQLVVERTNIGTLFLETFQLEDIVESFHQFVKRQVEQRRSLLKEFLRKELVEGAALDEQFTFDSIVAQYGTLIKLDKGRLCQLIVRVGKQM